MSGAVPGRAANSWMDAHPGRTGPGDAQGPAGFVAFAGECPWLTQFASNRDGPGRRVRQPRYAFQLALRGPSPIGTDLISTQQYSLALPGRHWLTELVALRLVATIVQIVTLLSGLHAFCNHL
jgi:hypothetical protein